MRCRPSPALCIFVLYILLQPDASKGERMTTRQVPAAEFKARCLRIIKEMNRDGGAVTITNRGRPVAVLSPVPASEETHSGFIGMLRGTVVKYEDPFEPATSPSDWSALR